MIRNVARVIESPIKEDRWLAQKHQVLFPKTESARRRWQQNKSHFLTFLLKEFDKENKATDILLYNEFNDRLNN
jgi:hypothetical protein